jgi:FkbM family methyltransferase
LRRGASVLAIEPSARYIPALETLARRFGRLTVCQAAASDISGYGQLSVPAGDADMGGLATLRPVSRADNVQQVRTLRLDDLELHNVSAIKIDVEGHEASVINGALQLIRDNWPFLMIEIEQRHISQPVASVIQMVEDIGYSTFFLESGSLRPAAQFSVATHQRLDRRPYINNFIFKPR